MAYVLIKLFSRLICLLPLSAGKWIGHLIGAVTWCFVPKERKVMAVRNVLMALHVDDAAAQRIAKASWTRFGRMLIEVLAFPKLSGYMQDYVQVEGLENLDKALAHDRGAILATAHSGNWELIGGALACRDYSIVGVAQKQTNAGMDRLINEYRSLTGIHVTYKSGVREMIKLLGAGHIVGIVMDQDAGKDGIILEFFGRPASCPQGPAFLARIKNAPVVPMFISENRDGTHTLMIQEALWVEPSDDKQGDIKEMTRKLTKIIENHIRLHPNEWFWLHNRWKHGAGE